MVALPPLELGLNAAQNARDQQGDDALTRKTKAYHHGDLAQALVTAGRDILRDEGPNKLSLRAVAARAGVSQSAPYSHFASKKDLLRAISASGFRELADAMEATQDGARSPREQILEYGAAYVDFALQNPAVYRLMISTLDPFPQTATTPPSGADRNTLVMEATKPYILLNGAFRQVVRNPDRAETLSIGAWSMVHGLASLASEGLVEQPPGGHRAILRALMDVQTRPEHNTDQPADD